MRKLVVFFVLAFTGLGLQAQDPLTDGPHYSELWTGFTLKKKLNDKFTVNFDDQIRFTQEWNKIRVNFMELGVKYKINKVIAIKAQYRYSIRNEVRNTRRISLDLSSKWKIKPWNLEFKYRARFQSGVVVYTGQSRSFFRNKFVLTYKFNKKWKTYASYESYYKVNGLSEFRSNRYVLGANYQLNKRLELNPFLQLDQEINVKHPATRSVFGLLFTYQFK